MVKARQLRILSFVPDGFPTFRPDVTTLFGKYLPKYGVSTDIVVQANSSNEGETSWGGGGLHLCPGSTSSLVRKIRLFVSATVAVLRLPGKDVDIVQVRDSPFVGAVWLLASWLWRKPFVYWMSYPMSEDLLARSREDKSARLFKKLGWWLRGWIGVHLLYKLVLPNASHVFVQSERMRDDVHGQGIPREKVTPVVMGVDPEEMDASRLTPIRDPRVGNGRVVAYLGTLSRIRGLDFLLDVHRRVTKVEKDVVLLLIGDADHPSDRTWLEREIHSRGMQGCVCITGWLPREEATRYVLGADIAVSPFKPSFLLDSCSPTKLVEYLALGKAVVASSQPDQKAVLQGSQAGLCVPHEVDAFANAILELLSNGSLRADMESRGPPYVRSVRSYSVIASHLSEVYRHIAATAL
ncbi:MAG: glycosyltransferase family 4 protein [Burkholderiales bacterium]|nr:glycosyltransferase family 4 protein [Burkholderiales bacterium]